MVIAIYVWLRRFDIADRPLRGIENMNLTRGGSPSRVVWDRVGPREKWRSSIVNIRGVKVLVGLSNWTEYDSK